MAKVRFNSPVVEIRGTLGDMVFKRSPQGKIIVTKKPDMSKVVWSDAQLAQRQRFQQADLYAKAAKADSKVWARYERRAKKLNKRPRDLAISDYFKGKNLPKKNAAK